MGEGVGKGGWGAGGMRARGGVSNMPSKGRQRGPPPQDYYFFSGFLKKEKKNNNKYYV